MHCMGVTAVNRYTHVRYVIGPLTYRRNSRFLSDAMPNAGVPPKLLTLLRKLARRPPPPPPEPLAYEVTLSAPVHLVELAYHLAAALCLSYLIYLFYHPHAPRVTVPLEADEKADVLPPERDRKRRTSDGKSIPCHDPSTGLQIGLVRSSHSFTR